MPRFPVKTPHTPPAPRYERVVALAGSQRVFVESPSESVALPKCQPAFAALPFTLDLTRSPLVAAMSVFFCLFFFVISSQVPSDPMSNYTPATNLITVAEEIAWFNSFQLGLIGAVRSDITHLGCGPPVTVVSFEARWGVHDMMSESESSNRVTLWKTTLRRAQITGIL